VQSESTETTLEVNGTMSNLEAIVDLDESQTTISEHPVGETGEYVSASPERVTEEKPKAVGTLIQPL
jgi:hypothetical protein